MKKEKNGFTLIETILAVALFAVMIVILSGTLKNFQRTWSKDYDAQYFNIKFVKVYRTIDRYLSYTIYDYLYSAYRDTSNTDSPENLAELKETAWFLFPVSAPSVSIDGYPQWEYVLIFSLRRPEKDNCSSFKLCPHKQLVMHQLKMSRLVLRSENNINSMHDYLKLCRNALPKILAMRRPGYVSLSPFERAEIESIKLIESDLFELKTDFNKYRRGSFELTVFMDRFAQKDGNGLIYEKYGSLSKEAKKRYFKKVTWTSSTQ